jgi:RimJ/RimL family protein N-acetyltransferase
MTQITRTERLSIRKFKEGDESFIIELLNSPGWLAFIGDRNIKNLDDAKGYIINGPLLSYNKFGFGPYLVSLIDSGTPIGMCSLIKRDELEDVDLGFAFLDKHSGKAYAYEASLRMIGYAKDELHLRKLAAITNTTNTRSIRLLEKLGFRLSGKVKMQGEEEELLHYLCSL